MPRSRVRFSRLPRLMACCVCLTLVTAVLASETKKEKQSSSVAKADGGGAEEVPEFTDARAPKPDGEKEGSPTSPLEQLQRQRTREAEKLQRISAAEKAVADAEAGLARLEKRLTATRNPFAARVELTEEEKKAQQEWGETASERYLRTELEVKKARGKVQDARKALAEARAGQ